MTPSSSVRALPIILTIIGISSVITIAGYFYFQVDSDAIEIKNISKKAISTVKTKLIKTPDSNEALTALFSITTSNNKLKIAKDRLASVWFEQSFHEGDDKYHAVFIKNQIINPETNEVYGSHADAPVISSVVYKLEAGQWKLVSKQADIGVFGSWGDAPEIKQVQKLMIAKGHTIFLLDIGYSGQGYTNSGKMIFSYRNKSWSQLGYLQTSGDNAGVCDDKAKEDDFLSACWKFDGKISLLSSKQNSDYPDLHVSRSGTMSDEDGNIIPVQSSVYSFNGEEYLEIENR